MRIKNVMSAFVVFSLLWLSSLKGNPYTKLVSHTDQNQKKESNNGGKGRGKTVMNDAIQRTTAVCIQRYSYRTGKADICLGLCDFAQLNFLFLHLKMQIDETRRR